MISLSLFSRWLDKLGLAARFKHEVVVRQTFVKGSYSLLDDDLDPNPVCSWYEYDMARLKSTCLFIFRSSFPCLLADRKFPRRLEFSLNRFIP